MSEPFASPGWISSYDDALHADHDVREAASTWVFGPMLLVAAGSGPESGSGDDDRGILVSIAADGANATAAAGSDRRRAPFVISASIPHWSTVIGGDTGLLDLVLQGQARCSGDLPTLMRHRTLLASLFRAARSVATAWDEESRPAPA